MKLTRPQYYSFSNSYIRTGVDRGFQVQIDYLENYDKYFYTVARPTEMYKYMSYWHNKGYRTEDECIKACIKHIDKIAKKVGLV